MWASLLSELNDSRVRDLAWVIGSPGLLDPLYPPFRRRVVSDRWCRAAVRTAAPWLQRLDRDPAPLRDFVAAHRSGRLGRYFELLLEFWLRHTPGVAVEATRLPLLREGRTLGEFDFLFRAAGRDGLSHWETAVKFYLQAQPHNAWDAYVGPNPRDRLELKLRRVFEHQLRLGEQPEGCAALGSGVPRPKALAFFKGYLFYPAGRGALSEPRPVPGISRTHARGWWFRHGSGRLQPRVPDARWLILERPDWLSPCRVSSPAERRVLAQPEIESEIERRIHITRRPLLVAELTRARRAVLDEVSRGFVVPASWPYGPP